MILSIKMAERGDSNRGHRGIELKMNSKLARTDGVKLRFLTLSCAALSVFLYQDRITPFCT